MTETRYGSVFVGDDSVTVTATAEQLQEWARRPGYSWPCSQLARLDAGEELVAAFDADGLYDLYVTDGGVIDRSPDVPGDELNAWSSDVLRDVLRRDHPAWFVAVGQFEPPSWGDAGSHSLDVATEKEYEERTSR